MARRSGSWSSRRPYSGKPNAAGHGKKWPLRRQERTAAGADAGEPGQGQHPAGHPEGDGRADKAVRAPEGGQLHPGLSAGQGDACAAAGKRGDREPGDRRAAGRLAAPGRGWLALHPDAGHQDRDGRGGGRTAAGHPAGDGSGRPGEPGMGAERPDRRHRQLAGRRERQPGTGDRAAGRGLRNAQKLGDESGGSTAR